MYGEKLSLIICCYKLQLILGLCVYKPRLGWDLCVCKRMLVLVCMCIIKIGLGLCVFMLAAASHGLLLTVCGKHFEDDFLYTRNS